MSEQALEKVLGPLEAEVMRTIWKAKRPIAVRDVLETLNRNRKSPLAYTTVMTIMTRLAEKGILRRAQDGRSYLYEAVARDAAEIAVRSVVRDFGDSAIAHFVEEARADPKILRRLQRLMREEE
jgi:predicted transcriptional regulator